MKQKTLILFLIVSILFLITGCKKSIYESNFFTYWIKNGNEGKYVAIYGLTELGKKQEVLIIPEYIDDMKVLDMGCEYGVVGSFYKGSFESEKLKRVYILFEPYTTKSLSPQMFENCPNIEKVIYLKYYPNQGPIYNVQSYYRDDFDNPENVLYLIDHYKLPANVYYMYNYDGSPNEGYYWVDDYDNELISYIPIDPIREGYTFDGWYKDEDCTIKWDFTIDFVPEKITEDDPLRESDRYLYKETILYAKWEVK